MSMQSDMVYGYGFETSKITNESLFNFVHTNMYILSDKIITCYRNIIDKAIERGVSPTSKAFWDIVDKLVYETNAYEVFNDFNFRDILLESVAKIMIKETGIVFEYQCGQEECRGNGGAIMLVSTVPWGYNSVEIELTLESFTNICKKYTVLLGIPDVEIEFLTVEYFG